MAFGCGRGKALNLLTEAANVVLACERLLLQAGKSLFATRFLRSVVFVCQEFAVLTARRLASPDGRVDSQWPELHETLDAMPARVSVENQLAEDLHRAMGTLYRRASSVGPIQAGAGSHCRISVSAGLQGSFGRASLPRRSVPSRVLHALKDRSAALLERAGVWLGRGLILTRCAWSG